MLILIAVAVVCGSALRGKGVVNVFILPVTTLTLLHRINSYICAC
jgi:hypothetical protein